MRQLRGEQRCGYVQDGSQAGTDGVLATDDRDRRQVPRRASTEEE